LFFHTCNLFLVLCGIIAVLCDYDNVTKIRHKSLITKIIKGNKG